MNKPTPSVILFLLLAALLLSSCSRAGMTAAAPAQSASGTSVNPGGGAQVSVSEGVILLTPGQPFPTQDVNQLPGLATAAATSSPAPNVPQDTPTSGPTADAASLKLPKGLGLYPGATGLDTSGLKSAGGISMISFNTPDAPDKVMAYYNQQLTTAGWKNGPEHTPNPSGKYDWSWSYNLEMIDITVQADPQAGTKVFITWMSL